MSPAPEVQDESVVLARQRWAQDQWITFCATSGMSYDEDGNFTTISVKQFAAAIGYDRTSLYRWKKEIPDFWGKVNARARELFNQQTKYAIFKGLNLKAMAGDVRAAEFVLSHYSDYTPPAQKHEVKLTGWGDVVREARKKRIKADRPADVVEAEVVPNAPALSNPTQPPQPPVYPHLPQPSAQPASPQIPTPDPPAPPNTHTEQPQIV